MHSKNSIDLVALAERYGATLKQNGNQWRGPCPIHKGKNPTSFVIRQGRAGGWFFTCYGDCQASGDAIQFVMMMEDLDFKDALERLDLNDLPTRSPTPAPARPAKPAPGEVWQHRAKELIEQSQQMLWSKYGNAARRWLHERGMGNETIKKFKLGLVASPPKGRFASLDSWGLSQADYPNKKAVWLPRGILIPCIWLGRVYYLKIRRPDPDILEGGPKTPQVLGSSPGLFGLLQRHNVAFITEGEWDAMLLQQAVCDIAGVATMGAAGHTPAGVWLDRLLAFQKIFVVGDNDLAGLKGSARWESLSQRVTAVKVPIGKDITDYWKAGGNLRSWAEFIIAKNTSPAPVAPFKTILWPAGADIATVGEGWRRLPDGRIEATYATAEELRLALEITALIRQSGESQESTTAPVQGELFTTEHHNYQE